MRVANTSVQSLTGVAAGLFWGLGQAIRQVTTTRAVVAYNGSFLFLSRVRDSCQIELAGQDCRCRICFIPGWVGGRAPARLRPNYGLQSGCYSAYSSVEQQQTASVNNNKGDDTDETPGNIG